MLTFLNTALGNDLIGNESDYTCFCPGRLLRVSATQTVTFTIPGPVLTHDRSNIVELSEHVLAMSSICVQVYTEGLQVSMTSFSEKDVVAESTSIQTGFRSPVKENNQSK